jgi:hypothetical protein
MNTKSRFLTITFLASIILGGASMLRTERSLFKSGVERQSSQALASLSTKDEHRSLGGIPCVPGPGGDCLVGSSMPFRNMI